MNNNNTIYKDTPLGKIPNDWEVKTLGELCKVFVSRDLKESNFSTTKNDKYKHPVFSNTVQDEGLYGYYDIEEYSGESLTIVGRGAGLGKAFTRKGSFGAIGRLLVLFPFENVNAHYITEYVNNKLNIHQESGGIPQLTGKQIAGYKIAIPNYQEQNVIAHILSLMDTAINKNNRLLAQKELQKKWLMQNLLTGKKRLLNDELGVINYELKQVRFGDFCRVSKGKAISAKDISKGIYPVIAGGQTSPYSHSQFTHENVITVSASGAYAGFVAFHGNKIWASDCSVIEEIENVSNIHYLYYFLKFKQDLIYSLQAGGAQPHVFPKDIYNLSFIIHNSIKEQIAIAQVLQAADKEIQLLKTKTEKLRDQKKGLMQVLLTGKKRLKVSTIK